jgi:hypothetical protein
MGDVGGAAQAGAQIATAGMQIAYAEKQAKRARERERKLKGEMETVKSQRPDITNPYEGITDLSDTFADLSGLVTDQSGKAVDMSGSFSNPFANVGVATEAAEFQAEQADISLANTLDTLAATGASAGGATALAQAALASKKGISADIQKQEQQNASLKAQGEADLQARVAAEKSQRTQNAEAMGKEYMFAQEERRTIDDLNRLNSQITGAQQAQSAAAAGTMTALGNLGQGLGNLAGSF